MKNPILLLCIVLLSLSCTKTEEPKVEPKGSVYVTVFYLSERVPGSQISTEPATQIVTSDLTGSAIISNVPVGGYKVNALNQDIGSGSASVTVSENRVTNVTINLIKGVFENPQIKIESPIDLSSHNVGDVVNFSASVSDAKDAPNALTIEWSSDRDGVLNTGLVNSEGITFFSTNSLSEGKHIITLKVRDSDNYESVDQITINIEVLPDAVTLSPLEVTKTGLNLNWTVTTENDFESYQILRSEEPTGPYGIIKVISDPAVVNFKDENVSYGVRYYYKIAVVLNSGNKSYSNLESKLFLGENIDLGVNIVRMIIDPERPYIYALDRINNSMLFINKNSKTVEKTILVGAKPCDIDINMDNSKAYIANIGSSLIAVIDLETQEKVKDLFVETEPGWGDNPYRLVCVSNDRIVFTGENQWNDIKLISASSGVALSTAKTIYEAGLLTNSSGTVVFATESGSTGSGTHRFNITGDVLDKVDQSSDGAAWFRDGCISGNDTYIFHRRIKYLANNLSSELGSFSENIIDCNYDGSIAIGEENIWNAETFLIIKPLPVSSSILRLDNDGNTIYIYDNNTSKIFITSIN